VRRLAGAVDDLLGMADVPRGDERLATGLAVGLATPSNWRLLNGADGLAEKQSKAMAPTDSSQVRRGPWWRSSRRGGAPRRRASRDHGHRGGAAAELALVMRAQRGGPRDREQFVTAYQPLIASVAYAYRRSTSVERDELLQEGVVGLLRALARFDPERGVPFWAYAAWWVRQAMQQVVSELSRPIVLSDRALRQLARIKDAQRRFEQTHHREANCGEVAAVVGLPRSQVESLLCAERAPRGLDQPAGAERTDGASIGEMLSDPPAQEAYERVPEQVLAAEIPGLLDHLSDREQMVVRSRYGLGTPVRTLREVAPLLGVSAERVRQIERDALTKLYAAAQRGPELAPQYLRPTAVGKKIDAR
jgi:RNA polymerase sigma factor (sigma-70 family)